MNQTKALLVVSFGTTYPETWEKTIEAIEKDLREAHPDRRFYRAWTSRFIRKKLLEREGLQIFSVEEALEAMVSDGITDVLIQPTHMLDGGEFGQTLETIRAHRGSFTSVALGRPLLTDREDIRIFAQTLEQEFCGDAGQKTAEGASEQENPAASEDGFSGAASAQNAEAVSASMIVWMGHGSASLALPVYDLLNEQFAADGAGHMCVGTVEFEPGIDTVLAKIREKRPQKVLLMPMLIVAGDHAINDLAGDDPESWKNQIRREGPEVTCLVKGLGEYPAIRQLYLDHALHAEQL